MTTEGPNVLLNIVPGRDPIAKLAKYTPASNLPQKWINKNLQIKLANEIENDEINALDFNDDKNIFFKTILPLEIFFIFLKLNRKKMNKKILYKNSK